MRVSPLIVLLVAVVAVTRAAVPLRRTRRDSGPGLDAAPASASLDAEVFGADPGQRADREKRLLLEQKVQIGNSVKNAVLGLIFGKINSVIDSKNALIGVFERANAAKNLALLGPGTKPQPAGSGIKGLLGGFLSSSAGSSVPALGGLSGGSSGGSGGSGGGGSDDNGGASLGASLGATVGGDASSGSSSASFTGSASVGYDLNAQPIAF